MFSSTLEEVRSALREIGRLSGSESVAEIADERRMVREHATLIEASKATPEHLGDAIRLADRVLDRLQEQDVAHHSEVETLRTLALAARADAYALLQEANPEQAWFWTRGWQRKEREADADYAAGHFRRHEDTEGFLAAMDAARADA